MTVHAVVRARRRLISVVFGDAIELFRAVENFLRHQMHHAFGAPLNLSLDEEQPPAHHRPAECVGSPGTELEFAL